MRAWTTVPLQPHTRCQLLCNQSCVRTQTRVHYKLVSRAEHKHHQYRLGAGKAGSQPSQYQGTWHCVSQVTASNIAGIQAGRAMECYLHFQLTPSGQLLVGWDQQGWSPANCSVVNFNPTESSIVHKSMSLNNVDWSALSQDRLRMLSCNIMQGHSRIVQYRAGQPVGVYETVSSLTRVQ